MARGREAEKTSHILEVSDSEKAKRIGEIKKAGLTPTIRVIASNLTEPEALLIESTLIWKLGKFTTNIAGGHFASKFRPHNTYHLEISGFDYQNGMYYYNVGEGRHRNWDDYVKYGFISAGQGERWRDAMLGFQKGDVVVAYLKRHGFCGIGKILEPARRIREVETKGSRLLDLNLKCQHMGENSNNPDKSEYVALVKWIKVVPRAEAKWKPKAGLFTTTLVRASLDGQPKTITFIEKEFNVDIISLVV